MKKYIFYLLAVWALTSCQSKEPAQAPVSKDQANSAAADIAPDKVVALGRIEPESKITTLSTEVNGIVNKINTKEGGSLKQGDIVLELSHEVEAARLALAQSKLQTQRQEIVQQQANLKSAQIKVQNYQTKLQRLDNMAKQGAETQQNLDNARTDYETALKEVERLQASVQAAQSRLSEMENDIRVAAAELSKKIVRAPANGTLLSLETTVGSMLSAGKSIGDFAPESPVTAICEVDELFAAMVKPGQQAIVREQGSDRTLASGEVIYTAPSLRRKSLFSETAGDLEDRRVREVRIRLQKADALLFNSRVECVIYLEKNQSPVQ